MIESALQIGVSLVVGWFGHVLVARQDVRNRLTKAKDEFMAVLADQRAKLTTESRREVFYAESVPVFVAAVYRLRYVLPDSQWQRLRAVLTDYESQGYKQFDRFQDMQAAFFKDRENSRQRLLGFLERFEWSIDENAV